MEGMKIVRQMGGCGRHCSQESEQRRAIMKVGIQPLEEGLAIYEADARRIFWIPASAGMAKMDLFGFGVSRGWKHDRLVPRIKLLLSFHPLSWFAVKLLLGNHTVAAAR